MKPLYMWAGGKSKMIKKYKSNPGIPDSGFDTYIEPFFGGGAMMIYVYENNPNVKKFVMNDINPEIVGIYRQIKNNIDQFIDRMKKLEEQYLPLDKPKRKEFYYDLRNQYTTDWKKWNPTVESATLYFLMKTAFNGIWQTTKTSNGRFATPSGLLNQKNSVYDYENVIEWHSFLQKVDIHCGDWEKCLDVKAKNSFLFADPPYRDSFTTYSQVFGDDQQSRLIEFCEDYSKENIVFLCNRDDGSDFFTSRVNNLTISTYDVTYTAGRRKKTNEGHEAKSATEVLLYNKIMKKSLSGLENVL